MSRATTQANALDKLLAFSFGVVFLTAILIIAIVNPEPSDFSYLVFRIVLALAAAGVGAVIPGFMEVSFKDALRAGGALALFVIVYFAAPAPMDAVGGAKLPPPPPSAEAKPTADRFLESLDRGDYSAGYAAMSEHFRERLTQEEFESLVSGERNALGPLVSRVHRTTIPLENPPGNSPGSYQTYGYRAQFAKERRPIYEAVNIVGEGGKWRVAGLFTYVANASGGYVLYDPSETVPPGEPPLSS